MPLLAPCITFDANDVILSDGTCALTIRHCLFGHLINTLDATAHTFLLTALMHLMCTFVEESLCLWNLRHDAQKLVQFVIVPQ